MPDTAQAGMFVPQGEKPRRRIFPFFFGITRDGLLYLAFVLLLSLAAVNTGNNLLYVIVSTLLSIIAVSGIISRNSLKQVSLALQMPENVFVGERVSVKVSMKNLKRIFPSLSIQVESQDPTRRHSALRVLKAWLSGGRGVPARAAEGRDVFRQSAYFPILGPGETRSEYTMQSFPRRGLYSLEDLWISTRFPFGFFRRGELVAAKGEVLVYPQVLEISSFYHLLPFLSGRLEDTHAGPGENLFSIRKYQDGESARIIDWKATSKTGEVMAREFAREIESNFCLVLDALLYEYPNSRPDIDFEKAVSLAAGIAVHFLREGAGMAFITPRDYIPRDEGTGQLYRILRSLALLQYEAASSADAAYSRAFGFPGIEDPQAVQQLLSDKVFKIILTSRPKGSLPSAIWRSSRVIYFDEL